jgi:FtsH-binding integral membrane protein
MQRALSPASSGRAANISAVEKRAEKNALLSWLAWRRRSRANKVLFVLSVGLAAFVTAAFGWAVLNPDPGNATRYFAFYWIWGLCALGVLLGMAEYKTSPLRADRERGRLYILLYVGALLIITRALNMVLYHG